VFGVAFEVQQPQTQGASALASRENRGRKSGQQTGRNPLFQLQIRKISRLLYDPGAGLFETVIIRHLLADAANCVFDGGADQGCRLAFGDVGFVGEDADHDFVLAIDQ
jgi:hypothetical protein